MALETHPWGSDASAWYRFVRSSPDGTVFHLDAWRRLVAGVFRHTPHYLVAEEDGEIHGVLPLFEVRGLLTGRVLISVPYATYGGLCASRPDARDALLVRARELARQLGSRYVEFRHAFDPVAGLETRSFFVTFVKSIESDPAANFEAIPRKRRNMIRKGMKHGLKSREGWESLPEFYEVYVRNRRRLGSPPFPRSLFHAIRDEFGDEAGLLTIWHRDRMVAGVVSLFFEERVLPYYAASRPAALSMAGNDFMFWELMRRSCLAGYRTFDFGQSHEGSGTYEFKRHWGFEPESLPYQYLSTDGRRVPDLGPSNLYRPFIELWKRLPLSWTRRIGPVLIRRLPLH